MRGPCVASPSAYYPLRQLSHRQQTTTREEEALMTMMVISKRRKRTRRRRSRTTTTTTTTREEEALMTMMVISRTRTRTRRRRSTTIISTEKMPGICKLRWLSAKKGANQEKPSPSRRHPIHFPEEITLFQSFDFQKRGKFSFLMVLKTRLFHILVSFVPLPGC